MNRLQTVLDQETIKLAKRKSIELLGQVGRELEAFDLDYVVTWIGGSVRIAVRAQSPLPSHLIPKLQQHENEVNRRYHLYRRQPFGYK